MDEIEYMTKLEDEINTREKMVKNEENKEVQRFKEMQSKIVIITTEDTRPKEKYFNKPEKSLKRKAQETPHELESSRLNLEVIPIESKDKKIDKKEGIKPPDSKKANTVSELIAEYPSDSDDD